jgi:hypothetical protein
MSEVETNHEILPIIKQEIVYCGGNFNTVYVTTLTNYLFFSLQYAP